MESAPVVNSLTRHQQNANKQHEGAPAGAATNSPANAQHGSPYLSLDLALASAASSIVVRPLSLSAVPADTGSASHVLSKPRSYDTTNREKKGEGRREKGKGGGGVMNNERYANVQCTILHTTADNTLQYRIIKQVDPTSKGTTLYRHRQISHHPDQRKSKIELSAPINRWRCHLLGQTLHLVGLGQRSPASRRCDTTGSSTCFRTCVNLTQLYSQSSASWRILQFPWCMGGDSASCPYRRSPLLLRYTNERVLSSTHTATMF